MSLIVDNVSFSYNKEREILSDISFELNNGESIFLLGPNGTGKTTLLKCINHILTPSSGKITINGENIANMTPAMVAKKIGYVPQYNNNVFSMNVIDTIMLGRISFAGRRIRTEDKDIVFDLIDKLHLQKFAFKNINEMSGGERQRVFIARALAQEPEIIILDEPTRNFSPLSGPVIRQMLAAFPGAIISISHDRKYIIEVCEKVYRLEAHGLVETNL